MCRITIAFRALEISMPIAHQLSNDLEVGTSFAIEAQYLLQGDPVQMCGPDGVITNGSVKAFVPTRLVLVLPESELECRPWRHGDGVLDRVANVHSNWTIHDITNRRCGARTCQAKSDRERGTCHASNVAADALYCRASSRLTQSATSPRKPNNGRRENYFPVYCPAR